MIKLIAFDLDGVLIDAKSIHYDSLNDALREVGEQYVISIDEHLSAFDGLPTSKKLQLLTEQRGLPAAEYPRIWDRKQEITIELIRSRINRNDRLVEVMKKLKADGLQICVASNSIRPTVKHALLKTELMEHVDFFLSNQDVLDPKPSPEIYLRSMILAHASPHETIVVEDSHVGQRAAAASGAHLCPVKDSTEVSYERISALVTKINKTSSTTKWKEHNLNVLIPMAGLGSRFEKAGFALPKPLIDVLGKPMIQMVVENLNISARYIYVVRREHYEKYNLQYMLNLMTPGCEVVVTDGVTDGAACTVLLAKEHIDNEAPLLLANSDQYVEWDSSEFMYAMNNSVADGGILTFTALSPKWSFAKIGTDGFVTEVAEKKPISDTATCGVYWFRHGSDFVSAAEQMISKDIRVNNEFYVCPVFNQMIENGRKIKTYHIDRMWGTGTPEDLSTFLRAHEKIQ